MKIGKEFINRQKKLLKKIGKNSIAIISNPNDIYYLTGFSEANAVAVFVPGRPEGCYIIFSQEKSPQEEVWTGYRIGQQKACEDYGADQAFSVNKADIIMPELIAGRQTIYFNLDNYEAIMKWTKSLANKERSGINQPSVFIDIREIVHEMRIVKDKSEISVLRKAAKISAAAHLRAMRACRPGMMEHELEAELMHEFTRYGGKPAFGTIVAGGINACVLHYEENNARLKDGDLVLIDAGVNYKHYAGDISRTFPVNGKFTAEQKKIYQAVLDVQLTVIKKIRPGVTWYELQQLSERLITEKLINLKLLRGKIGKGEVTSSLRAFEKFYMHKISHWLGLDCHDVGKYRINDGWRKLEPGMVLTVEPGIYIKEKGIGIRIEDDVLVTKNGCEVLTADVPKIIEEIEKIMHG